MTGYMVSRSRVHDGVPLTELFRPTMPRVYFAQSHQSLVQDARAAEQRGGLLLALLSRAEMHFAPGQTQCMAGTGHLEG